MLPHLEKLWAMASIGNKIRRKYMKIVAIALGTYGDVEPFVVLGKEMIQRGYEFELVAFSSSAKQIQKRGLKVTVFPGDCNRIIHMLYNKNNTAMQIGNIMQNFFLDLLKYRQVAIEVCASADLIMYMQFGAFIRHFAEAEHIPCIRTSVYPDTPTKLYAVMNPLCKRESLRCYLQYQLEMISINMLGLKQVNSWRKSMSLKPISVFTSDRKSDIGTIPTLYQYSKVLAPPDSKWNKSISVTGTWEEEITTVDMIDSQLEKFLELGDTIYIGFGSMLPQNMSMIQKNIEKAIKYMGIRAVISIQGGNFVPNKDNENIFYTNFISYDWLFPKVKAIICHGGCGTVHKAISYGVPTLVMAFGGDQFFWGLQVAQMGAGPYPINMKTEKLTINLLQERIKKLLQKECRWSAKKLQDYMKNEKGCKNAADFIEKYLEKERRI